MAITDIQNGVPPTRPGAQGGTAPVIDLQPVVIRETPPVADPAPLGLAAFALTTFLLSATNAHWIRGTGLEFIGFALAYGGLAQFAAGMWEFRNRNVFGATAFSTYGAFWIGLACYFLLVVPSSKATQVQINNDLGWIILGFLIINSYLLLWSLFVNKAVFGVFLTLEVTEILLVVGNFSNDTSTLKVAGIAGVVTAAVAWYTSAAGLVNGMQGRTILPVGKPLTLQGAAR